METKPDITIKLPTGKAEIFVVPDEEGEEAKKEFIQRVTALLALDMMVVDAVRQNKSSIESAHNRLDELNQRTTGLIKLGN